MLAWCNIVYRRLSSQAPLDGVGERSDSLRQAEEFLEQSRQMMPVETFQGIWNQSPDQSSKDNQSSQLQCIHSILTYLLKYWHHYISSGVKTRPTDEIAVAANTNKVNNAQGSAPGSSFINSNMLPMYSKSRAVLGQLPISSKIKPADGPSEKGSTPLYG